MYEGTSKLVTITHCDALLNHLIFKYKDIIHKFDGRELLWRISHKVQPNRICFACTGWWPTMANVGAKLGAFYLRVPQERLSLRKKEDQIRVFGYFYVIDKYRYELLHITPIPQVTVTGRFWCRYPKFFILPLASIWPGISISIRPCWRHALSVDCILSMNLLRLLLYVVGKGTRWHWRTLGVINTRDFCAIQTNAIYI